MNKQRLWPLLFLLTCLPVAAVELGTLQPRSNLNQPLEASLPLRGADERELAGLRFSLADRATYRRYRLHPPFDPQSVDFSVVVDERGQSALQLRSRQPVTDPIVDILLKVMSGRDGFLRRYTLFLDPAGVAPLAVPMAEAEPNRIPSTRPNRAPASTANGLAANTSGSREFVQQKGLSISMIAQNSKLHEKYSVYQIMRAVYLTNPKAFADGNINRLIYGSRLVVPAESLIAEVARREAIEFVKAVSRDHPATVPTMPASRDANRAATGETAAGTPQEIEARRPIAPASGSPVPLGGNQPRTQESSAGIIGVLTERGEPDRDDADTVQRQLEAARPVSTSLDTSANVEREAPAQDPAGDRSREIAELDRELQQKDLLIRKLTRRIEALQQSVAQDADAAEKTAAPIDSNRQPAVTPAPAAATSPAVSIVPQSSAPASGTIRYLVSWGLPALALLLVAVIGLYWWRRVRREPPADTPLERLLAEEVGALAGEVDIDITQTSLRSVPEPAAEPTPPKPQPAAADDASEDQTLTRSEELILEVDVRLAYELYPEALEMLEQARQEHGDALWIDTKTLETYAAMGKRSEFLALFEQKRDALQAASPIVWAEISALHAGIERQSKISSAG